MADDLRRASLQPASPGPLAVSAGTPAPQDSHGWSKRPAFHPEEGEADKSDWVTLVKSLVLILGSVAFVAFLLSR